MPLRPGRSDPRVPARVQLLHVIHHDRATEDPAYVPCMKAAPEQTEGWVMAKNTGDGERVGAVKGRSQVKAPNGNYVKRDTETGRFLQQKKTGGKFKGVRKEK